MEDVKALRRIVFDSRLNISEDMLTENMSTTQYAENDMKYLDRRHELLQTFRVTRFHPTNAEFPIKQQIAEKIAGSGMSYQDLRNERACWHPVSASIVSNLQGPAGDKNNPYYSQDRRTLQSSRENHKCKHICMAITTLSFAVSRSSKKQTWLWNWEKLCTSVHVRTKRTASTATWRNYILMTSRKTSVLERSKHVCWAPSKRWIFLKIGTCIGFFLFSFLGKTHQILYIH